jgi:hypothetical protein
MWSTHAVPARRSLSHSLQQSAVRLLRSAAIASGLLSALAVSGALAQNASLVSMEDLGQGELRTEAFVLDHSQSVRIRAAGAERGKGKGFIERTLERYDLVSNRDENNAWQGNAWILDAATRQVVWELRTADADRDKGPVRSFDGTVRLKAGTYEAYYGSFSDNWRVRGMVQGQDRSFWERLRDDDPTSKFRLSIEGDGRRLGRDLAAVREEFDERTVVSLTKVAPSSTQKIGFTLERPTEVDVYSIGEARQDGSFDYGWIINADTREKVWQLRYDFSDPAGGAEKNRMEHRVLRLPAGRYAALYSADDSHDSRKWNDVPPYDPAYYGLTIRVAQMRDRSSVSTFPYELSPSGTAVVALTRLVDNDSKQAGFSLSRPADVRIYAIGEGSGDQLADYGWIVDANSHQRVWTMTRSQTDHAGGAEKNRVADRIVHLDAGDYMVYFVTDDSHSYEQWNSSPPVDQEHWGISIYPARDSDRGAFGPYEARRNSAVLAEILRVRDDEHRTARFTLDDDADVRVEAVGEASDEEMVDGAWIEDARSHRRVWSMEYDDTQPAGGADKNREVARTIHLDAGEYILHYRTDDSHAFGAWNADPPNDPARWGVTVSRARRSERR